VAADPYAWQADPEGIAVAVGLLAAYALVLRSYPAPRARILCFTGGVALLLAVQVTPAAALSNHYLLSIHLLQNIAIAEWAPALCVLGIPPALAAALGRLRAMRVLTQPLVALPLWLGTYFAWHLPWAYDAALTHPDVLLHVEHASYFAAGCLLWWPALQREPHRLPSGARALYLFGAFVLVSPLGLLLSLLQTAIYDFYVDAPRLWGLSPLADQQLAGVIMTGAEAVVFFAACAYYLARFLREEEAAGRLIEDSR
jgi:cytochrome c oxidase assembly factor CtaG